MPSGGLVKAITNGAPFRDILEDQHMGSMRRYSDTRLKIFLSVCTHAYEKPEILNNNFPLK